MMRSESMSSANGGQNARITRWSEVRVRCCRFDFIGGLVSAVGFSFYVAVYFVPMTSTTDEDDQPDGCGKKLHNETESKADVLNKHSVGGSGLSIAESMSVTMQVFGILMVALIIKYAILGCVARHALKACVGYLIFVACFVTSFIIFTQAVDFPMGCFALPSTIVVKVAMSLSGLVLFISGFLWMVAAFVHSEGRFTWRVRCGGIQRQGEGQPLLINAPV